MLRFCTWCGILLLSAINVVAQGDYSIDLSAVDSTRGLNITDRIRYVAVDTTRTPERMLSLPATKWVIHANNPKFNPPITQQTYWIKFSLRVTDTSADRYFLHINNRGINELELYQFDQYTVTSLGRTGDHFPFTQRPYPAPSFIYPLSLHRPGEYHFMLYCDKRDENLNVKLSIITQSSWQRKEMRTWVYVGLFCGILTMAFVVTMIMLALFRDRLNFWYGIYILLVINLLLVYEGLDFQWLYPSYPFYASISRYLASSITLAVMMYVMQLFCNQQAANSRFFRATNVVKYSTLCMVPYTIVLYQLDPIGAWKKAHFLLFLIQQFAGIFLILLSTFEKILQRYKPALFYFAAVLLLLYSAVAAILLEIGVVNMNAEAPNLLQWSFVLEVALISIGILYKYRLIKQENLDLLQELSRQKIRTIRQLFQTQRQEQIRIAEDLHDVFGAKLSALRMSILGVSMPAPIKADLALTIDEIVQSSKVIAHNLHPPELNNNDLSDVIEQYLNGLNQKLPIMFEFVQIGTPRNVPSEVEVELYKITMELINNIIKHAHATYGLVQLGFHDDYIELIIEDNGIGIPEQVHAGMGLLNIQKRITKLQGHMHLDSKPGSTTFIFKLNA